MRFLYRSMMGLFLTAASLALLIWAGVLIRDAAQARMADDRRAPPARERVFTVNVVKAEPGRHQPMLETFGEIASRRTLELRAASGGRVTYLADSFVDGGLVRKGDVLLRIDPADAHAAKDRAESDLADAQAEGRDAARGLELAQDELTAASEQSDLRAKALQRQVDLAARGVGTQAAIETAELAASSARQAVLARRQALQQAQARVDSAATRIARMRIALSEAERHLADMVITAPFDGTLSGAQVVEGRLVSANERLAELVDANDLEVSFRVSTAQYVRLLDADGMLIDTDTEVLLDVSGVDLLAKGRLSRASAGSGSGQTGRVLFAALGNAPGFKPGDFVTVRVKELPLDGVVTLPASALDSQSRVLVLGEGDRLEEIKVELLRRQGDDVLVRGPIAGREVVRARSPVLGAGIAVKPLREGPAVAPEMLELTEERRARLIAFVEANDRMPKEAKQRVLARLAKPLVPAAMVARIESRMGG